MNQAGKNRSNGGYTLVEAIIYIFLLAMLLVVLVTSFAGMIRVFAGFRAERAINHSATVGLERLLREIKHAGSVNVSQSVFNSHPGRLLLTRVDTELNSQAVEFFVEDGVLFLSVDGVVAPLTARSVEVNNLVFRLINTPYSQAVRVELGLVGRGSSGRSQNFYSAAVLRESY